MNPYLAAHLADHYAQNPGSKYLPSLPPPLFPQLAKRSSRQAYVFSMTQMLEEGDGFVDMPPITHLEVVHTA